MDANPIPANLRRLRREKRLAQEALAARAGLSRSGLRKIEMGEAMPQGASLQALADALEVRVQDLVAAAPVLQRVRFRSSKALKRREEILVRVGSRLEDYRTLERLLDKVSRAQLRRPTSRDAKAAAAEARRQCGLEPKEPIRDICGLLEARGIKVITVPVASEGFFGLSVAEEDGGPAIAVNTWERISVERWIFSAAHELGHLLLHRDDYDVEEREEEKKRESEANLFASHFLMPDDAFFSEWDSTAGVGLLERVFKVKRMFRVSYKTVLYRLQDRHGPEIFKIFQVAYKRRFGKTIAGHAEPQGLERADFAPESSRAGEPERMAQVDFIEDRLFRLVREAVEQEHITLSRAAEILDLSLPEMRELSAAWVP